MEAQLGLEPWLNGAAIWFNPAGLPFNDARLLQGSLSLIQRRTLDIEGALVSDAPGGADEEDQVEDLNLSSRPTLPGFAVASFALGKKKPELNYQKPVQVAVSVFQTYNDEIGGDINFQGTLGRTNDGAKGVLRISQSPIQNLHANIAAE